MHRLRVISFDKVISEKENNIENSEQKPKRHHDSKNSHKAIPNQREIKTHRPKAHNSTNTERKVLKKDNYTGLRTVKKISFASITENFRHRTKDNFLKSLSSIKTISLDDIRRTLINNVYGNRRQKKTQQCHKYNATKKNGVHKRIESQDDIKVLYTFERTKSPDNGKRDCNPAKNPSKRSHFVRRSSSDIFGIGRVNRANKNTYVCFHTSRNTGLFPKPKKRKKERESMPYIIHQVYPVSVPSHKPKKLRFQNESTSDHFNVVGFPMSSKLNDDSIKLIVDGNKPNMDSSRLKYVDDQQDVRPRYSYLSNDQELAPFPSSAVIAPVNCRGDASKPCVCEEVNAESESMSNKKQQEEKEEEEEGLNSFKISTLCPATFIVKCRSFLSILKSILTYALIVLCIIIWSPCILAVAFCWLLVYPLRPHHVLKDDKYMRKQFTSTTAYNQKGIRKSICTCIMEWIIKISRRIVSMILKLYKLAMNVECNPHESKMSTPSELTAIDKTDPKTPIKWQPNPDKRYILYFDCERGWLMKPLRSEVCEDFKRPEVVQNLCFDPEPPSRSNRAVTFSDAVQEEKGQTNEIGHPTCLCPPTRTHEHSNNFTQTISRETNPPKCKKCLSRKDIIYKPVNQEHEHKKKKQKFKSCVICPPISLCHPCPKRKKLAHKPLVKQRVKRTKCKQPECMRRPPCKIRRPNFKRSYRSKAPAQYVKDQEEDKRSMGQMFCDSCKDCAHSLKDVVCEAEKAWDVEINCTNLYIHTLRKRPCFWIYYCCRSIYPAFLSCHRACCNFCQIFMLCLSVCIWCPIFLICYLLWTLCCGCCR